MLRKLFTLVLFHPDPSGNQGGNTEENEQKPDDSTAALAKALQDLRENSVSKEDYEKLEKEKKELVQTIINGGGGNGNGQTEAPVDVAKLRAELYGPQAQELSNLEYCRKTLQLRAAIIKETGEDPFLPHGANIKPTAEDREKAENVAQIMQECIDKCEGDTGSFTALLQARTNPDNPALSALLKKKGGINKEG